MPTCSVHNDYSMLSDRNMKRYFFQMKLHRLSICSWGNNGSCCLSFRTNSSKDVLVHKLLLPNNAWSCALLRPQATQRSLLSYSVSSWNQTCTLSKGVPSGMASKTSELNSFFKRILEIFICLRVNRPCCNPGIS